MRFPVKFVLVLAEVEMTDKVVIRIMASGFIGARSSLSIYGKQKTLALSSSKPLTTSKDLLGKRTYL